MEYQVLNQIKVKGSALLHNYHYFQQQAPHLALAPVIKSNAYGHGLIPIARWLSQHLSSNIPFVCVDSLYEAYELTKAHIKLDTLIMGYTNPLNFRVPKPLPFIFAVWDRDSLLALAHYQPRARIHLKLNTGMNRLGLTPNQIPEFARLISRTSLRVEGVYSHLARADEPHQTANSKQLQLYLRMVKQLESFGLRFKWKHLAATAGLSVIRHPSLNLARLGIGFYGYSPFGSHTKEGRIQRRQLQPALTLISHIANLIQLKPGDQVGYGGTYQAKQTETIATLPIGYNDGINRHLSNIGSFTLKDNTLTPIVGRVSMNMTTIKIPRTATVKLGDPVIIITPNYKAKNSLYQQAKLAHTIPYEILTNLHPSIRRQIS